MLKIAILGYGVVGKGVDEIASCQKGMEVTRIFDRPELKEKVGPRFSDLKEIVTDETIDVVVEAMGGDEIPHLAIVSALQNGKHVVTSNKETVSKHLNEYLGIAKKHNVSFQFEASCMGGVPLIYPLMNVASFDEMTSFKGILNGTSNYILSQMEENSLSYEEALKGAQEKGFAERDPSADVLGIDTKRKVSIIASVTSKKEFDPELVPCFGITGVTSKMLLDAKKEGAAIRLVGSIEKDGDEYSLIVAPTIVEKNSLFGQNMNEINAISAYFEKNGPLSFQGPGAGRYPTAAAIMQDIERIVTGGQIALEGLKEKAKISTTLKGKFICYEKNSEAKIVLENPNAKDLMKYEVVLKETRA